MRGSCYAKGDFSYVFDNKIPICEVTIKKDSIWNYTVVGDKYAVDSCIVSLYKMSESEFRDKFEIIS